MLTNETTRKLQEMHLGVMAKTFTAQLSDTQVGELAFEDRFAMLVDAEWAARKSNHLKRLIKKADFADPGACIVRTLSIFQNASWTELRSSG